MIVRISNEGQYRLDDGHHHRLDELDDAVVAAVAANDENDFQVAFEALHSPELLKLAGRA